MAQHYTPVVIGRWRNGRPIYLAQGGSGETQSATETATAVTTTDDDTSFPANTPVAEMTPQQQVNYWKTQSRKHEGRATTAAGLLGKLGVADEAAAQALIEKRDRADALANDLATDTERAAREAREAATSEVTTKLRTESVEDAFRLVIGDSKTDDEVSDFLADLNLSRFVGENGRVDTAKVRARAGQFATVTATTSTANTNKGPTVTATGAAKPAGRLAGAPNGSDLYDRLHPKKTA